MFRFSEADVASVLGAFSFKVLKGGWGAGGDTAAQLLERQLVKDSVLAATEL